MQTSTARTTVEPTHFETRFAHVNGETACPVFWTFVRESAPRPPTQIVTPFSRFTGTTDPLVLTPTSYIGDPNAGVFHRVTYRHEGLAPGVTAKEMEDEALRNLCRRPGTWEDFAPGVIMCSNDFLAAERILHPGFLIAAARRLGDERAPIVVAIPKRAVLLATALKTEQADITAFVSTAATICERSGVDGLSRSSYLVVDGSIMGAMDTRDARS